MGHKSPSSKAWLATQDRREILATRHGDHTLSVANKYAMLEAAAGQTSVKLGNYAYRHNANIVKPILRSGWDTTVFSNADTQAAEWVKPYHRRHTVK